MLNAGTEYVTELRLATVVMATVDEQGVLVVVPDVEPCPTMEQLALASENVNENAWVALE